MYLGQPNLVFEAIESQRLVVSCQTAENPSDRAWDAWLAVVLKMWDESSDLRLLVLTEGGHPTVPQIERMIATRRCQPRTAILSGDARTRFVVSTLTFFNRRIHVFPPARLDLAYEHLDIDAGAHRIIQPTIERLTRLLEVAPPHRARG